MGKQSERQPKKDSVAKLIQTVMGFSRHKKSQGVHLEPMYFYILYSVTEERTSHCLVPGKIEEYTFKLEIGSRTNISKD